MDSEGKLSTMESYCETTTSENAERKVGSDGARTRIVMTPRLNLRTSPLKTISNSTRLFKDESGRACAAKSPTLLSALVGAIVRGVLNVQTKKKGRAEEALILDQIERAKIAACLKHFRARHNEATQDDYWFDMATNISERNNGYLEEVRKTVADIDDFLLAREKRLLKNKTKKITVTK